MTSTRQFSADRLDVPRSKSGRAFTVAAAILMGACVPSDVSLPISREDSAKLGPSPYQPERPYSEKGPGLLSRMAFSAAVDRTVIEVQDLLVAPRSSVVLDRKGAVIYELRDGTGVATIDGKAQPIGPGAVFAAGADQRLMLENRGDAALVLRANVFTAK